MPRTSPACALPLALSLALSLLACAAGAASADRYAQAGPEAIEIVEATWHDAGRQRDLALRLYRPKAPARDSSRPLIVFSHGLGGSNRAGELWGAHWASHGFVSLHLQHPGSDTGLLREARSGQMRPREALGRGANAQQFQARLDDVRFVLDELERRQARGEWRDIDLSQVGMSGHSFGARTTMALAGERFPRIGGLAEPRFKAALAFSPAAPGRPEQWPARFGSIRLPFLSITGSRDDDVMGTGASPENRREPYRHMPAPDKYLLVIEGAAHDNFGGRARLANDAASPIVLAVSTAFWRAHLRGDKEASQWLRDGGAREWLGARGTYEFK